MSKNPVSAKEVAELAGVSRAAVSRCFTPGASIAPETRAKILKAADQLGYQVNRLASGLIRNESGIVALIAADIAAPYRSELLSALTGALQRAGKLALVINTDRSDSSVEGALRQAISYRTDAAIFLSGAPARSLAETCQRNGMRLVLINRDGNPPGSLLVRLQDAEAGTRGGAAARVGLSPDRAGKLPRRNPQPARARARLSRSGAGKRPRLDRGADWRHGL